MDPYIQSSTHGVVVGNTQVSPSFPDLNRRYQPRERWIQHYSSSHKILLVGEGDFSFSASLAMAFDSATNMVATSLDPREFLFKNYQYSEFNISHLWSKGCTVMHEIDATKMANHYLFKGMTFDRIIFNFPLAGFFPSESRIFQISRNQKLIRQFLENAKKMISDEGEIHITHKSSWGFFRQWNLEDLAIKVGLKLIEELPFNVQNYTGYNTKYGFGGDNNFNCNPSKTYIFGHEQEEQIWFEQIRFLPQHHTPQQTGPKEELVGNMEGVPKVPAEKNSAKETTIMESRFFLRPRRRAKTCPQHPNVDLKLELLRIWPTLESRKAEGNIIRDKKT